MTYALRTAVGKVQAGETDIIATPRNVRTGKYGAILLHGASTRSMGAGNPTWPSLTRLVAALGRAGIPVVMPSQGLDQYANDTHMARIDSALTTLGTLGSSTAKAHLLGVSMGGGACCRYAGLNPGKVASVNALIPMVHPVNLYQGKWAAAGSETNIFAAPIATAWGVATKRATITLTAGSPNIAVTSGSLVAGDVGSTINFDNGAIAVVASATAMDRNAGVSGSFDVTVSAPLPAGANLTSIVAAAKTAGVPGRLFYGSADPYIKGSDVTTLATAAGWAANQLAGGSHDNSSGAAWASFNGGSEFSDLVSYLLANGA